MAILTVRTLVRPDPVETEQANMAKSSLLERYMEPLIRGSRRDCRTVVLDAMAKGIAPRTLYHDLVWPAMARVDQLYREDRIDAATEHLATRVNRVVADHLQSSLDLGASNDKRVLIVCANGEPEELGGQMCADLFEADGWDTYFAGGGVPDDEIQRLVGQLRPHLLLIFGSKPTDAPGIRMLIDRIREVDACPTMNIMVSGGVFNRAEGLWEEVKADLFAATATDALEIAATAEPRKPVARVMGAPKKRRRRRRPPLLLQAEAKA